MSDTSARQHGWAIVMASGPKRRTLLHTNWVLGRGVTAWPGMLRVVLFDTRFDARCALRDINARTRLPFPYRIVKVTVTEEP